jgi:hypothetical protein
MLIQKYSKVTDSQTPLHAAAAEGAHEVVKLLLEKGASIDKLDDKNRNCLDIAISKGHREVVKVLLADPNWEKLIRLNNFDDENVPLNVITNTALLPDTSPASTGPVLVGQYDEAAAAAEKRYNSRLMENPEIYAMFEHKMWDSMKIGIKIIFKNIQIN